MDLKAERKRILIFSDYYLPSVGAGGGVRILANIVERFSDEYDFFVVARDHDSKTDRQPFSDIPLNRWTSHAETATYYFSKGRLNSKTVIEIVDFAKPDVVFLNSVFSVSSVRFLWERRKGKFQDIPLIISPCGELMLEGLRRRSLKKLPYLALATLLNFHKSAIWRATSPMEEAAMRRIIGKRAEVHIAPDLTPLSIGLEFDAIPKPKKLPGEVRFAYVARVVPNKNLLFLLEALREFDTGKVSLEIVGPLEDKAYWKKCSDVISSLPRNVAITSTGVLPLIEVLSRLRSSHFFVLPSKFENFGYAIIESLALATPVLISDQTPWNYLDGTGAGWILSLDDPSSWRAAINLCSEMDADEYTRCSEAARSAANQWLGNSSNANEMKKVFLRALESEGPKN